MNSTNAPVYPGLPQSVQNQQLPAEGPKSVPVQIDFSVSQSQTIDLSQLMTQSKLSLVQGLYIDNSTNDVSTSVQVLGTNQLITAPPNTQGYYPILAGIPTKLLVTSASTTALVPIYILNMPMPAVVWSVLQEAFTFIGGALEVTDVALDGTVNGNAINVIPQLQGSSGPIPEFDGDTAFTGSTAATGDSTIIAAPGVALAFFLKHLDLSITADAAISGGAAELTITINDGATIIATAIVNVPASSGAGFFATRIMDLGPLNLPSLALNNALTINLSSALSTGKVVWNVIGGTSTVIA